VDALLGGREDSALLIDENGITKKGDKSVGMARQWNGRLGNVENCQVGVYAALSRGSVSTRAIASENYGILLDYFQGNCDNPLILIAVDKSPCVKRTSSDP